MAIFSSCLLSSQYVSCLHAAARYNGAKPLRIVFSLMLLGFMN
jgi:hypothetical protein